MQCLQNHQTLALKPQIIYPGGMLQGRLQLPGDKSITHRALILGSLVAGAVEVIDGLQSLDCLATLKILKNLGVSIEARSTNIWHIQGVGLHGLRKADEPLDVGNAGTAIRLLSGILVGQ